MNTRNNMALFCASSILLGSAAFAGVERDCTTGTLITEVWGSIPIGGIPLTIVTHQIAGGNYFLASNMPTATCSATMSPVVATWPGAQSVMAAAAAWTNVTSPGNTLPMSSFAFATTPIVSTAPGSATVSAALTGSAFYNVNDGMNTVNLNAPPATFAALGGLAALGATGVSLNALGKIVDADIALNARATTVAGLPAFSFVETNALFHRTFATDARYFANPGFANPVLGYLDMQGVLTHELGHAAGLAHSFVDSTASSGNSFFPTMFPVAQVTPISGNLSVPKPQYSCGTYSSFPISTAGSAYGGIAGVTARTLEADDRSSLAEGYPGPALATQLGTITGLVLDSATNNVFGAHVVAMSATQPHVRRVGTIAHNGVFTIMGLPADTYHMFIEPVDTLYFPGFAGTTYFASGCLALNPNGSNSVFQREFMSGNFESSTELRPLSTTPITLAAGQTDNTSVFFTSSAVDVLRVCAGTVANGLPCAPGTESGRGIQITRGGAGPGSIFAKCMITTGNPGLAGNAVYLLVDTSLANSQIAGQQFELGASSVTYVGLLNAAGSAIFDLPIDASVNFQNLMIQPIITASPSTLLGNKVNVWVSRP